MKVRTEINETGKSPQNLIIHTMSISLHTIRTFLVHSIVQLPCPCVSLGPNTMFSEMYNVINVVVTMMLLSRSTSTK